MLKFAPVVLLVFHFAVFRADSSTDEDKSDAHSPPRERSLDSAFVGLLRQRVQTVQDSRECFCTYDYDDSFVKAQIGHKRLKRGDKIMRGETVSFACKFSGVLLWQNGFRFFGKANMTCNSCRIWQSEDLPTCSDFAKTDAVIGNEEDLKILPGGTVHLRKGDSYRFFCSSTWRQPQWEYGENTSVEVNKTQVHGPGRLRFVSYLDIMQAGHEHSGTYKCFMQGRFSRKVGSSLLNADAPCYTKDLNYPGLVKPPQEYLEPYEDFDIRCELGFRRAHDSERVTCSRGRWNITENPCIGGITCPWFIPGEALYISYSNGNNFPSWATFVCPTPVKMIGERHSFCQQNGTWSSTQPHCDLEGLYYVSCPRFSLSSELDVRYSGSLSLGIIAKFSCSQKDRTLVGSFATVCREDGTWRSLPPSCEDSKCSIHDLYSSIPETMEPDMTGVNSEFVSSGSGILLKCSDNSVLRGNPKVLCEGTKWNLGSSRRECVPYCVLDVDPSSHLLIQPEIGIYRSGDIVSLSCPPGEDLSDDVERLTCLGGAWSHSLPFCKEKK